MPTENTLCPGDIVTILPKEHITKIACVGWNDKMNKYCGQTYKVLCKDPNRNAYKLSGCRNETLDVNGDGYWLWDGKWLDRNYTTDFECSDTEFMDMFD